MTLALTRASTLGPIANLVRQAGGSVDKLFRAADLPCAILDRPQSLILLRDQFRLVETAARMVGDDALPARLAVSAGLDGLGSYGRHVMSFSDLGSAISVAYRDYGRLLQASTVMDLSIRDRVAIWTYRVAAPFTVGRQKNELLALGYMLDILRRFAGSSWVPDRVEVPGVLAGKHMIADLYGCPIRQGSVAAIVFPAAILECPAPIVVRRGNEAAFDLVPSVEDIATVTRHSIRLERLAGRSGVSSVSKRMGMTVRTLQRRLAERQTTFSAVLRSADHAEAVAMLSGAGLSVTEIAEQLGYSDTAHFSRAFRRWTGTAPSRWSPTEQGFPRPKAGQPPQDD